MITSAVGVAIVLAAVVASILWIVVQAFNEPNDHDEEADRAYHTELDRELEAIRQLETMPWPQLRSECEALYGRPCECTTRHNAARRIYFGKARQERSRRSAR